MDTLGVAGSRPSLPRAVEDVLHAAGRRVRDVVELAAAEARLAALSGAAMLALAIVTAAALLIAWLLLVACAVYLCARAGLGVFWPTLALALIHVALAWTFWRAAVRLSRNLTLPELRTTLGGAERTADGAHGLVADNT